MSNPYRAMCAELIELCTPVDSIPQLAERLQKLNALADRARALLAQPEPERLTDEEIIQEAIKSDLVYRSCDSEETVFCSFTECCPLNQYIISLARAVLARFGRPTPQPAAVSERLPRPEDCTAQGWCWVFHMDFNTWTLEPSLGRDGKHTGYTHWLPANALPTPEATNE